MLTIEKTKNTIQLILYVIVAAAILKQAFFNNSINIFETTKIVSKKSNFTFKDVIGLKEVKKELLDSINYLKNIEKYIKIGARFPRGILLTGNPGNGKTLIANAVAGEINCDFYSLSGSELVSKWIGDTEKAIRDLFKNCTKYKPVVIFIDELDAIGSSRTSPENGLSLHHNSIVDELLAQIDRLEKENIPTILIGATNNIKWLDPALVRPGRFDKTINITNPTLEDRIEILEFYSKKIKIEESFNFKKAAALTAGLSSSALSNLMNQAALIAIRENFEVVNMNHFDMAIDNSIMGLKSNVTILEKEITKTAFHEAGHTLFFFLEKLPVDFHKVTIEPRGKYLGAAYCIPQERNYTKEEIINLIKMSLGGRIAEEIFFNEISTGASNDLETATYWAEELICTYGMEESYIRVLDRKELKHDVKAKEKVSLILNNCYQEATRLINKHKKLVTEIAQELQKKKTLSKEEIEDIIKTHAKAQY